MKHVSNFRERLRNKRVELGWMEKQYGVTSSQIAAEAAIQIVAGELQEQAILEKSGKENPKAVRHLREMKERINGSRAFISLPNESQK